MKCPIDQTDLVMSERQGVEIDYCPQCRGVWLDRGELDKILDRAADQPTTRPAEAPSYGTPPRDARYDEPRYDERRYDDDHYRDSRDPRYRKKKRESWLGDLLDFG